MERECEAHLSTERSGPQAAPRISRAHGDQGGTPGAGQAAREGPQAPFGIRRNPSRPSLKAKAMHLERLKKRTDFVRAARNGRRWTMPGLVVQAYWRAPSIDNGVSDEMATVRIGYTASIRGVGNAVARNRAKRRLRAAVDAVLPDAAAANCDYVLIANRQTVTQPFETLIDDLRTAIEKLGKRPRRKTKASKR